MSSWLYVSRTFRITFREYDLVFWSYEIMMSCTNIQKYQSYRIFFAWMLNLQVVLGNAREESMHFINSRLLERFWPESSESRLLLTTSLAVVTVSFVFSPPGVVVTPFPWSTIQLKFQFSHGLLCSPSISDDTSVPSLHRTSVTRTLRFLRM